MTDKNIAMYGYLSIYVLLPLLTKLTICSEKVITYLDDMG